MKFAFRAIPKSDLRAADVAMIGRARFETMDLDENPCGAPELVIKVNSPLTRSGSGISRRCVGANGSTEFCVVDEIRSVTVISAKWLTPDRPVGANLFAYGIRRRRLGRRRDLRSLSFQPRRRADCWRGVEFLRHAARFVGEPAGLDSQFHRPGHLFRIVGGCDGGVHEDAVCAQLHCDGGIGRGSHTRIDDQGTLVILLPQDA